MATRILLMAPSRYPGNIDERDWLWDALAADPHLICCLADVTSATDRQRQFEVLEYFVTCRAEGALWRVEEYQRADDVRAAITHVREALLDAKYCKRRTSRHRNGSWQNYFYELGEKLRKTPHILRPRHPEWDEIWQEWMHDVNCHEPEATFSEKELQERCRATLCLYEREATPGYLLRQDAYMRLRETSHRARDEPDLAVLETIRRWWKNRHESIPESWDDVARWERSPNYHGKRRMLKPTIDGDGNETATDNY